MEKEQIKKLYKMQAKVYDITRKFFLFNRNWALKYIENRKGNFVIDYWCWTGLNYKYIKSNKPDVDYFWIDLSDDMLEIAKKNYWNDLFVKWDVTEYKNKSDTAICTYVLSMVDDYENTILNIKDNLNENWTLIVLDFYPYKWILNKLYPLLKYMYLHWIDPKKPMIKTLEKHFTEVKTIISPFGHNFISLCKK